jgi:hypothetical protein
MTDPELPVRDPSEFVGQSGTVRRIFSRIGAERPQSVAVIGGKKSGKTSLLTYIADDGVRRKSLEKPEAFVFATVCAGCDASGDPVSFLSELAKLLPGFTDGSANKYESVRKTVDALHAAGKRVVVLLDDFHLITQNEHFPLEFFSFLRSMANNYNLAYLTTSFLALQKLCVAKDVQESPFFNIFTNLSLGMLATEEARELFTRVSGMEQGAAARIAAWCGNSPYVLKKAAVRLGREKNPESVSETELERILLPETASYFLDVISMLPPEALKPLQSVAKRKNPDPSDVHHLNPLVKQGFLSENSDGVACSSPLFLVFLQKNLSAKMLRGKG